MAFLTMRARESPENGNNISVRRALRDRVNIALI
jgi:hypothetical protein